MTKKPKHTTKHTARRLAQQTDISRPRVESGERPVDAEIRAAGERIGYVPREPKRPDPMIHQGILVLSDHVSKLTAAVVSWRDDCDAEMSRECASSLLEDLADLNREIWRIRWDVDGLADHEVAS